MKHFLYLFALASLMLSSCQYEDIYPLDKRTVPEDYRPFVKEGKRWDFVRGNYNQDNKASLTYSYLIQGDTIIGKRAYKKYLCKDPQQTGDEQWHYVGALREDAMQVLYVKAGSKEENRLYDFGVHVGDKMKWNKLKLTVENTDGYITVSKGFRHRTIIIDAVTEGKEVAGFLMNWIEGIGGEEDYLQAFPFNGKLSACYEDDTCIYDAEYVGVVEGDSYIEPFEVRGIKRSF